jgi:hypothetical protein
MDILKREDGRLKSPSRLVTKKVVERDTAGRISGTVEETLAADASPAEIKRAIEVTAQKLADHQTAREAVSVVQRAANAAVEAVKVAAKTAMDSALAKMLEEKPASAEGRPTFTPADQMSPQAFAEAEARYARMVLDTVENAVDDEDIVLTDEEVDVLINTVVNGVVQNFSKIAAACGLDVVMHHDEDGDEDEIVPGYFSGRRRKSIHKSRRHDGPIHGPRRWSR